MISTLIKLFTEDFYKRRKVVNELPIQPVIPSLQQDDSDLLFHECPNCNCRCNCTDQPCSCCNHEKKVKNAAMVIYWDLITKGYLLMRQHDDMSISEYKELPEIKKLMDAILLIKEYYL